MARKTTKKQASPAGAKSRKNKKPTFTEMARRKQIVQIAFDLFMEKGYDQTSIEEIAEEVGVSRGVIFYYFKGKRDIGEEVVVQGLRDYSHFVQDRMNKCESPKERLVEFVSACLDYSNEHRQNFLLYVDTMGRFSNTEGRMDFFRKVNDNTREMLVYLQYDEWDNYTFYKRFEDGDERDVIVEGTLDVERVPAWGKVRADSDLRLGVVSGKPRLRGLIFLLHLDDGRNLLVLGLQKHGVVVETLA